MKSWEKPHQNLHVGHRTLQLEWFGGNQHAYHMATALGELSNTWDDLVDKDREVSDEEIHNAFLCCLVYLPTNPFYVSIQHAAIPMWTAIVSAYEAANKFEQEKDRHGLEIAHTLRYAMGFLFSYAISVCVGTEKAREFVPLMWKSVAGERFDGYVAEHIQE